MNVILLDTVEPNGEWGRWAPAGDLLEHRGKVLERVAVRERGKPVVADDGVELGLAFPSGWSAGMRVHRSRGDALCKWWSEQTV